MTAARGAPHTKTTRATSAAAATARDEAVPSTYRAATAAVADGASRTATAGRSHRAGGGGGEGAPPAATPTPPPSSAWFAPAGRRRSRHWVFDSRWWQWRRGERSAASPAGAGRGQPCRRGGHDGRCVPDRPADHQPQGCGPTPRRDHHGRELSYRSESKHTHAGAHTVLAMTASRTRARTP